MTPEQLTALRTAELERIGIHTTIKKITRRNPTTGKDEEITVRVLEQSDSNTVEAFVVLGDTMTAEQAKHYQSIPGVMELRKQFLDEVNSIEGCVGCKKGAILRKYIPRVTMLLNSAQAEQAFGTNKPTTDTPVNLPITVHVTDQQNTGTGEVPSAGAASDKRAPRSKSLLRRSAEGIAKILRKITSAGQ